MDDDQRDRPDPTPGEQAPLRDHPSRTLPRTEQLCQTLVEALGMDGASVAMITDTGSRDLVHASDPLVAHLDELQFTLAEGPCLDAYRTLAPVLIERLEDEGSRAVWPVFALQASVAGADAVFAFPLLVGDSCFGVLELYRRTPGPLSAASLETVQVAVDAVTQVALDELSASGAASAEPSSWPGRLTDGHAGAHQAAGMVAVHLGTDVEDAMARLRAAAFSQELSLAELAERVLSSSTRLDKDTPR